jgi:NTP pyrophosphatase (non-canonical NTP hydrolase)
MRFTNITFSEYQKIAITTELMERSDKLNASDAAFIAKLLGLSGEAGEVAEKFKKIIRDRGGVITAEDTQEVIKELGDVLWYISAIADYLGVSLEEVASNNLNKVLSRKVRGQSHGSGDNR